MDEIRRKLELIDRQLAGRSVHERLVTTCPLVFAAVGLVTGILVQSSLALPVTIWLILLCLCAVAAVFVFVAAKPSPAHPYVTAYLAMGCFVCLGAVRLTGYRRPEPNDICNCVGDERKLATIRGSLVTDPYVSRYPDWKFARFKPTDPTSSFYMNLGEVKAIGGWMKTAGVVRVQVDEPVLDLKAGDAIQAYCWLERFGPPTNPGQFDTAAYLARRNIFVGASVKSRDGIEVLQGPPASSLTMLRGRLRQLAAEALVGDVPEQDTSRGLLEALLLGERRRIDSDTYRAFRKTGLLHFISLSGLHLGILVGIIWWLCRTAGLLKPARAIVCAMAICVFLLIVPPRAPTIRAAIIAWVFCASILARRHANPVNTLALAAIILLLIRPTELFEAGWQLSFVSVLAIILFADRIESFMRDDVIKRLRKESAARQKLPYGLPHTVGLYALKLLAVGLAAWLGSAGVLLYHFYTITPLASLWTVLVFPFVGAILALGFLKMLLFLLLPTLSIVLGAAVTFLSDAFIGLVKLIAHLDISDVLVGRVPLAAIVFYYGAIAFIAFASFRRPLTRKVLCTSMLLAMVVYLGAVKWQRTWRDELVLTCLDVGHGQAILAQLPGKANVLFDAGSLYKSDVGSRIVAPFLDYSGIGKIDAVIISHNDTDHINGIPEVVEHCEVVAVLADEAFFDKTDVWGTARFLGDCLSEQGLEIKHIGKELDLRGGAAVKVLWPGERIDNGTELSDNDRSLVSLVEFAGAKILLCSDIEDIGQRELLRLNPDLKADVILIPHHGSAKTRGDEFSGKLDADVLICSCDLSQYERMVDVAAQSSGSAGFFYTARHGAIRMCVREDGTTQTSVFTE